LAVRIRLTKSQRRRKIMKSSPEESKFILNDGTGTSIRNLIELAVAMEQMKHEVYANHVNEQKNDFSNWVRDVLEDRILAANLQEAKNKTDAQITILKHLVKNLS
jgi:hypothetical protein